MDRHLWTSSANSDCLVLYDLGGPKQYWHGYVNGNGLRQCQALDRDRFYLDVRNVGRDDGSYDGSQRGTHDLTVCYC